MKQLPRLYTADAPPGLPPASPPPASPPPAAAVVATGKRTEREVELEAELEKERSTRKQREIRLSELEDETFRLKQAGLKPAPAPAPVLPASSWTFFG